MGAELRQGDGPEAPVETEERGPRRSTRTREIERRLRRSRFRYIIGVVIVSLVVAGSVAWFGVAQGRQHGQLVTGVSVCGLDLGGLEPAAAEQRLAELLARRGLLTAHLELPDGSLDLPLERLGITVDIPATVAAAMRSGRVQLLGFGLWTGGGGQVAPVVRVDPATYTEGLVVVRDRLAEPPVDAALRLQGGDVVVMPAEDGTDVDDIRLERAILESLAAGRPYSGEVPTRAVLPDVGTAEVEGLRSEAASFLRRPIALRYRARTFRLQPDVLATMLAVNQGDDADERPVTFDDPRARELLAELLADVARDPVAATVRIKGKEAVITRSKDGRAVDMDRLVEDLDAVAAAGGSADVRVRTRTVAASPTTEELYEMGLTALGSEFTTYYSPDNKARAANIARAAELVDGTIVRPGRTFSLNDTLGPRTVNRGFDAAPVIVDGVLRQGVGGGICQFATTLFNAVFFAGLPVTERHPHTFAIDHYPVGRDAAVSWGSADMAFRNDTGTPLMVRCWTGKGSLSVVIVGDTGREVTYTTGRMRSVRRPSTTRTSPRVVEDPDVARGVVTREPGARGYSITVKRTVRRDGKLLFVDRFVSTYEPRDWVRRVGTGPR